MLCPRCGREYADDVLYCPRDGAALTRTDGGDPWIGRVVADRYRIEARLGSGAYGDVYRAIHVPLDRPMAIKLLKRSAAQAPGAAARFLREARTISRLRDPHTVQVFDFGEGPEGRLFIAMDLIDGCGLDTLLAEEGPLPPERVARIADQIARSLGEAHGQGVVHRDLKPSNVMLDRIEGRSDFVRVLDFGIAKLETSDATSITDTGVLLGTPRYIAPEVWRGEAVDGRADLYALGALLYEMLTGGPPFVAREPTALMFAHCSKPAPALPATVGEPLRGLVAALLAKEPADRPADAEAVRARLSMAAPVRQARRPWLAVFGVMLGVVALGIGLATRDEPTAAEAAPPVVDAAPTSMIPVTPDASTPDALTPDAGTPDAGTPDATSSPRAPAPPEPRTGAIARPREAGVRVELVSHPAGAGVRAGGRLLCTTPCTRRVAPGTRLSFRLAGYLPTSRSVPARGGTMHAELVEDLPE